MKAISDASELRHLEKEGIVVFHPDTLKKVTTLFGAKVTVTYVEDVKPNNKGYFAEYISGSFYPYVYKR